MLRRAAAAPVNVVILTSHTMCLITDAPVCFQRECWRNDHALLIAVGFHWLLGELLAHKAVIHAREQQIAHGFCVSAYKYMCLSLCSWCCLSNNVEMQPSPIGIITNWQKYSIWQCYFWEIFVLSRSKLYSWTMFITIYFLFNFSLQL